MNRYPLWKNLLVIVMLLVGLLYTSPNFFGDAPAVQVSSIKTMVKTDEEALDRVKKTLDDAKVEYVDAFLDPVGVKVRLADENIQMQAKTVLEAAFNPDAADPQYSVALNLMSRSPAWMASIGAKPMYLGLDLRGGVHFLMRIDMQGALTKRLDSISVDMRRQIRDKKLRNVSVSREGERIIVTTKEDDIRDQLQKLIISTGNNELFVQPQDGNQRLVVTLKPEAIRELQAAAIKQNISTLHNRINELGVAEPVIQQQGVDRIVVQLPGIQDVAKAKEIIGRTATLEIRLVDDTPGLLDQAQKGQVPYGLELYTERGGQPLLVKKQVVLTGDRLIDAQAGFDPQDNKPAVHLRLDSAGATIFKEVTRENIHKRMAILLFEKGKGEVVTAPVIQAEIGGGRVQISGSMTAPESHDIALLLRAGALAAPMDIIEERTIGPSLGRDAIEKGFHSTLWGFVAIAVFMTIYYMLFGFISVLALASNLLLLVALLSLLQATLTLPGIAAIALVLGMAIDANVLINERIREELRHGATPQAAIFSGYDRAFDTILDSNVTTLIAGIALLLFGSGPVRGFAVVHCLGIMTSMFSAVVISRAIVNFVYGRRKVQSLAIGQVWRPDNLDDPNYINTFRVKG